jgi:CubicO group peptidase (beta-lactamase class C family)
LEQFDPIKKRPAPPHTPKPFRAFLLTLGFAQLMTERAFGGDFMAVRTRLFKTSLALVIMATSALTMSSCASVAPAGSVAQRTQEQRVAEMVRVLQDGVDKNIAAGFAVALTDGQGRTNKGFVGMADRENRRPIANDTVYRLYSMTKPVTAVAIMMLVEDGRINLDAPLETYIPSFANARVYESGDSLETLKTQPLVRPLTVRDLMRQTSGMPYIGQEKPVEKLYFAAGIERAPGEPVPGLTGRRIQNLQELSDRIAATPLSSQPGAIYTYGNAIDVLGHVVEVASGKSLGSFFKERIFDPLDMPHTAFHVLPADRGKLASGYLSKSSRVIRSSFLAQEPLATIPVSQLTLLDAGDTSIFNTAERIEFGGSGLVGTLDDYVRFAQFIANSGELGGKRLLKATTIAEMGRDQLTPQAAERLLTTGRSYGLGFGIIVDTAVSKTNAPVGTMFWAGAAGTYFWANPATRESGVLMTQVLGDNLAVYQGAAIRAAHGITGE